MTKHLEKTGCGSILAGKILSCAAVFLLAVSVPLSSLTPDDHQPTAVVCARAAGCVTTTTQRISSQFMHHELKFRDEFLTPSEYSTKFNLTQLVHISNDCVRQSWCKSQWGWD